MRPLALGLLICCLAACGSPPSSDSSRVNKAPVPGDPLKPLTEADLGLKFYPGSRTVTSGQADGALSANLETSDGVRKVAAFYEHELGTKAQVNSDLTTVEGEKDSVKYAVAITASKGKTSISIMGSRQQ